MRFASALAGLLLAVPTLAQDHRLVGVVRGADRKPFPSAVVTIRWRTHPELPGLCGHTFANDGVTERVVTADERGRFRAEMRDAGPFEVIASSADGELSSIRQFPVMAGGFTEIELQQAPWIGGVVRNSKGEPVPGFEIALEPFQQTWQRHRGCGSPIRRYRVKTDEQGRWRLVYPSGYLKEAFWEPYLVAMSGVESRLLDGSGLLMLDARCQQLELASLPPRYASGTVVDEQGKPIAGASVFDPYAPTRRVKTDEEGRYRINVKDSKYLRAIADGYAIASGNKSTFQLRPTPSISVVLRGGDGEPLANCDVLWSHRFGEYPPVEHATRTDGDGAVALGGAGLARDSIGFVRVDGVYVPFGIPSADAPQEVKVRPRSFEGTIVDTNGTPLAGARVMARSLDDAFDNCGDPLWITYSDHGGRFRFRSLPTGDLVFAAAAGAAGFAKGEARAADKSVELRTGDEEAFVIEVLDGSGKPLPGAWVTLVGMGNFDSDLVAASPSASPALVAFTGDDGVVSIHGAPDGQWMGLAMRVRDGQIEAADMFPLQRGTKLQLELEVHGKK